MVLVTVGLILCCGWNLTVTKMICGDKSGNPNTCREKTAVSCLLCCPTCPVVCPVVTVVGVTGFCAIECINKCKEYQEERRENKINGPQKQEM